MRISIYKVIATLCTTLILGACGSSVSLHEFNKYNRDKRALRLLVQVCLPNNTAYFDDVSVDVTNVPDNVSFSVWRKLFKEVRETGAFTNPFSSSQLPRETVEIRKWRNPSKKTDYPKKWINIRSVENVKGIRSKGGLPGGYLTDSTNSDQPVFQAYTHERPRDILAIYVVFNEYIDGKIERTNYWYKVPANIKSKTFTPWTMPISEEGPYSNKWISRDVIRGKKIEVFKVRKNAPRIRYTLMNNKEYSKYREIDRSAINIARLERLVNKSLTYKESYFIPGKRNKTPSCKTI